MDFTLFGLTNRDKRVYEALLAYPGSSVRSIAEHTGINRGSVFESIKDLQETGLVSYVLVGDRKKFSAEDPEKMHEIISERRRILRDAHGAINEYAQHVPRSMNETTPGNFASFYDGEEGVASVLRDVLITCRIMGITKYRIISSPRVSEYMYHNYPHYTRERLKQGLYVYILRQGQPIRGEVELSERRFLNDQRDLGAYTLIYGSKVATISIDKLNRLSAVVIDNQDVAHSYDAVFDQAWTGAVNLE